MFTVSNDRVFLFPTSKRRSRLVEMVINVWAHPRSHLHRLGHHFLWHLSKLDILLFFEYWCNHQYFLSTSKWFWCLNRTKQRVKAELANYTQTVVFQLRFVRSMTSPPPTVGQILLIIYTVVGTAGHDFVIVWWDWIVFGVVCFLCFLGGFFTLLFLQCT